MNVQKIIGAKPIQSVETISPQETLSAAAALLSSKRIGALIVGDGKAGVAGIISERDIVRRLAAEGAACLATSVASAMTTAVMSCAPSDSAVSVLQRMTDGRFRHMPVIDDGRLVGVISIGDVVKARMSEIEMENRAMEDMIKGI
ncbi:CBS domain-containing protein [Pikeienuella piscinae]|uniref:CBS domain-containing protein n=1 Tax=Pikeienuella piscinae TaxID=2748098 RepID=A0A7L5BVG6_9RHOB|nr:CBS domain-containing protein [Pikeienuella piscinae]QIE54487.1 CBS domain-containing protein [Pikeienuella piscinae]